MNTRTSRYLGLTIHEHTLGHIFARELVPDGGEDWPAMVYFQGGPGFGAPRPQSIDGVIGQALKTHRVILLDQRGTGRSQPIDVPLAQLRQEYIVHDAEELRKALGFEKWSLYGQSFGGFCITAYQSMYPESVTEAYITGGLPSLDRHVDDVYRAIFSKLLYRHRQFYTQFPWIEDKIREVCHHLDVSEELLPTGERLSSRRLRTIGIDLGRSSGFYSLAYLFEDPFVNIHGEKRLRPDFLVDVGQRVSFAGAPLYAAIHESIYGGIGGTTTNWSAHRIREEFPGCEENADPRSAEPFYLTGEHIFPWQFDEDPALQPYKAAAEQLATTQWEHSPYDAEVLKEQAAVTAACVYLDDAFVPFELSMDTAHTYRDLRLHVTNRFQHDGIRWDGAGILSTLRDKVLDH